MRRLLATLFGCAHERTTFPQRPAGDQIPHVTCLGCGAEFEYHWNEMRVGLRIGPAPAQTWNPLTRPTNPTLDSTGE